ncbi:hypothetical protein [Pseudomonas protegens]
MKIPVAKNEGGPLIEIIEALGETEWRKGASSEFVAKERGEWVLKVQSQYPPTVSFRFKNNDSEIVGRLREAVSSYSGKIKWILSEYKSEFSVKVSFVIEPFLLLEVRSEAEALGLSSKQYVAKFYSEFGAVAFEDLAGLAMHVRQEFQEIEWVNGDRP